MKLRAAKIHLHEATQKSIGLWGQTRTVQINWHIVHQPLWFIDPSVSSLSFNLFSNDLASSTVESTTGQTVISDSPLGTEKASAPITVGIPLRSLREENLPLIPSASSNLQRFICCPKEKCPSPESDGNSRCLLYTRQSDAGGAGLTIWMRRGP